MVREVVDVLTSAISPIGADINPLRDIVPTHPSQLAIWGVDVWRCVLGFRGQDASPRVRDVGRIGGVGGEPPVASRGIVRQ